MMQAEHPAGPGSTLYEKLWARHVVCAPEGEVPLLYIDRHLVHEVTSPQAFAGLDAAGRRVRRPDLTLATTDHDISTKAQTLEACSDAARAQLGALVRNTARHGVRFYGLGHSRQGIVHIVGPETGFTLPGTTIVCGDSHTATHGAFGALAFGIGTSEVEHVLATQTLRQPKLKTMRITCRGKLRKGVFAKDLILAIARRITTAGGTGHAIEFAGEAVEALSMEGRMTLSNMAIEVGAKAGLIAPDETTFAYLKGRPFAPKGEDWERAVEDWKTLRSDPDAVFDAEIEIDASAIGPFVTWGTNPGQAMGIEENVPDPTVIAAIDPVAAHDAERALEYVELTPNAPIEGTPIDTVFIGSCTNGRLEDFRAAAEVLRGRRVAPGVRALAVPGSMAVRHAAEAEGLDKVFKEAGFEWRWPGCSMCLAMNDDKAAPGSRVASTSNRNFVGRQGKGARTHLMSPAMAAAAAVTGRITDVRKLINGTEE